MEQTSLPGLLTVAEVAERLRIAPRTVRTWCGGGHIPAHKIGKSWRIDLNALLARDDGKFAALISGGRAVEIDGW
jgi:excisionase family DNA binding protein